MPPSVSPAFTKLVVHDLEGMAAFYREAYGLHAVQRISGERIGCEKIDEILLSTDPAAAWGALVLLRYLGRGAPPTGEAISASPPTICRTARAGMRGRRRGRRAAHGDARAEAVRAFATDPEGHLAELVQLVP